MPWWLAKRARGPQVSEAAGGDGTTGCPSPSPQLETVKENTASQAMTTSDRNVHL